MNCPPLKKLKKWKAFIILFFIVLAGAFTLSACGYTILRHARSNLALYGKYGKINGIFIKPFKNLTYKSGIGAYFSNSLAYYLNTTSGMFTSNQDSARYFLNGKITSITNSVISYTGVAAAVQYSISATVMVSLYKTSGKVVFRNVPLTSNASYFNYVNPFVAHKQEKMALKIVSKRIAKNIIIFIETKVLLNRSK